MKKVKYKVNDNFGDLEIGDIVESYLIEDNEDFALLYHPWAKGLCPSFEIAKRVINYATDNRSYEEYFTGQNADDSEYRTWINIERKGPKKFEEKLLKALK